MSLAPPTITEESLFLATGLKPVGTHLTHSQTRPLAVDPSRCDADQLDSHDRRRPTTAAGSFANMRWVAGHRSRGGAARALPLDTRESSFKPLPFGGSLGELDRTGQVFKWNGSSYC
jgi:hypothetical protein